MRIELSFEEWVSFRWVGRFWEESILGIGNGYEFVGGLVSGVRL